jgi:uncharacterized protein YbjT (DUF2867 family)
MHVALIGATGNVGSRLLADLLSRKQTVAAGSPSATEHPAPGWASRSAQLSL